MSGPGRPSVQFTVNVLVAVVFLGVVTLTKREPVAAPLVITKLATSCVGVADVTVGVTPVPLMLIDVPAVVKLVPVKVTVTVVPRAPEVGAMLVSVGVAGLVSVKSTLPVVPPAVVTETLSTRRPKTSSEALGSITKFAVTFVALTKVRLVTVTPVAPVPAARLTLTASPAAEKFVPVSVTATVLPRDPVIGEIEVSVGVGGLATTVKVTGAVVPPEVLTVTVRAPKVALPAITKLVVIEVAVKVAPN